MEKIRVHLIIEGRVQGVFFRHHTREMALRLGLTGWVMNRPDGSVEALFEGDSEQINDAIDGCRRGPPQARVARLRQSREVYQGEFGDFSIR
jgi:acylphosphatase